MKYRKMHDFGIQSGHAAIALTHAAESERYSISNDNYQQRDFSESFDCRKK